MKKINTKLFGLLFMLALGNSSYMILGMETDDEYEYSFVSPNEYSIHDLDASSLMDPALDSDDDDGYTTYEFSQSNADLNEANLEPFPHLTGVPDTFVVTEVSTVDEMPQPQHTVTVVETQEPFVEAEFTGSKHERRHAVNELMHDVREELHDADETLRTTERQLEQLEHTQEHRHVDVAKERRQQSAIEKNIATAQKAVVTATRQIQRLAHSTDNVIRKEFEPARTKLTQQLNKTTNELNKVTQQANRQLRKVVRKIRI